VSKHLNIPITEIEKWLAIYDSYNRRQKWYLKQIILH
jgi:hypothetical protein